MESELGKNIMCGVKNILCGVKKPFDLELGENGRDVYWVVVGNIYRLVSPQCAE